MSWIPQTGPLSRVPEAAPRPDLRPIQLTNPPPDPTTARTIGGQHADMDEWGLSDRWFTAEGPAIRRAFWYSFFARSADLVRFVALSWAAIIKPPRRLTTRLTVGPSAPR